ncbi:hypothetical protein PCE1_003013 [Barthelona sp. PCE]
MGHHSPATQDQSIKPTLNAAFENGNLLRYDMIKNNSFHIYSRPDAQPRHHKPGTLRSWFHFYLKNASLTTYTFYLQNIPKKTKLWKHDMRPVIAYSPSERDDDHVMIPSWEDYHRIDDAIQIIKGTEDVIVSFQITVTEDRPLFIALTFPFCLEHFPQFWSQLRFAPNIRILEQQFSRSHQNRPVYMYGVTSFENSPIDLTLESVIQCQKPVIIVTARVHPGETPSSHVMNGFIQFLATRDTRAALLLEHFLFVFIPFLNPDGVAMGHWRNDSRGLNMNRMYGMNKVVTIDRLCHWLKEINTHSTLALFLDLHAHANKRGCFIYGNAAPDSEIAPIIMLYPRLLSLYSPFFDFNGCAFTQSMLTIKDKRGESRMNSGRVWSYINLKNVMIYTLECNYCCSRVISKLRYSVSNPEPEILSHYTPSSFHHVGYACCVGLLDLFDINEQGILRNSEFGSLSGLMLANSTFVRSREAAVKEKNKRSGVARRKNMSRVRWDALGLPTAKILMQNWVKLHDLLGQPIPMANITEAKKKRRSKRKTSATKKRMKKSSSKSSVKSSVSVESIEAEDDFPIEVIPSQVLTGEQVVSPVNFYSIEKDEQNYSPVKKMQNAHINDVVVHEHDELELITRAGRANLHTISFGMNITS